MATSDVLVLFVNGRRFEVLRPDEETTLLTFLRQEVGLGGTKLACGEGSCGSCTVTLARRGWRGLSFGPVNACLTKLCSLHATAIWTADGIDKEGAPHPVQERLHFGHGAQCGFCTPGVVMAMHARLVDPHLPPVVDVEDIVSAVGGNLCRCTGYRPIVEAMETFCTRGKGPRHSTFDDAGLGPYASEAWNPVVPEDVAGGGGLHAQFLTFDHPATGKTWHRPTTLDQLAELQKRHHHFRRYMGGTGHFKLSHIDMDHKVTIQLDAIEDLRFFNATPDAFEFGSGLTLSEWSTLLTTSLSSSEWNPSCKSLMSAYAKALQLGSPQLRNVARVGGSLFYIHPCSDLIPLHMVCGASIEVLDKGQKRVFPVDETFCSTLAEEIQRGSGIVTKLILPKPKEGDNVVAAFFKKSRRKSFDLAILNIAILAKLKGNVVEDIRVSIGGAEEVYILPKTGLAPVEARSLQSLLKGINLKMFDPNSKSLVDAIKNDIPVSNRGAGDFGFLRRLAALAYVKEFLSSLLVGQGLNTNANKNKREFYQFFKNVDAHQDENDLVERPVPHMWSKEMAKGSAIFTDDIKPTCNELVAVLIRSTIPYGKIISINFEEALKAPGIVGKVSAKDLSSEQNMWGISGIYDEEVFASETVYYHGQPIAALYCTTEKLGRAAVARVQVKYTEWKPVLSIREERKAGNSLEDIQSFNDALVIKRNQSGSEVLNSEGILKVTGTVALGRQEHAYMEPHSAIVIPTGEKDEYVCYFTTQEPGTVQKNLSRVLQVPYHKIIVKTKRTGGAFGGKERLQTALIAAACAKKSGKPVRCILSRSEDMGITGHRHEVLVDYDVSFDSNSGRIVHSKFQCFANAGHSTDLSVAWITILMLRLDGGYTLTNFNATGKALKTNVPSNTAFRGFGGPEGAIIIEEIIAKMAHLCGLDINKIKEVNLTKNGDKLHHSDNFVTGCTLDKCWTECLRESKFDERLQVVRKFNSENDRIKRGISITPLKFAPSYFVGPLFQACAQVKVYLDGTVLISHGGIEMGQGLNTKLIQVASRELSIDAKKIHVGDTSTEVIANAVPTGGSTGSDLYGHAVIEACRILVDRIKPYQEGNPDGNWEDWITAANMAKVNLNAMGFFNCSKVDYNVATNEGTSYDYLTYGAGCVEVEVDCHTGDIKVSSAHLVLDVGRSLNPAIDIGQIEGAFLQGLGYVTTEQLIVDSKSGKLLTDNFSTYKIPTVHDMPDKIHVTLLTPEANDEIIASTVYSSKGIGEPPIMLCSGITSAVREAITSYRKDQGLTEWFDLSFPLTSDKVCVIAHGEGAVRSLLGELNDQEKFAVEV